MAIRMYTGSTSQEPIIDDLVKVVAKPNKKDAARVEPNIFAILFIIFFTIFF